MIYGELRQSKGSNFYFRRVLTNKKKFSRVEYFEEDKITPIPLAKARCNTCKKIMQSKWCGDFVSCPCGASAVDTDRWYPKRHRTLGDVTYLL